MNALPEFWAAVLGWLDLIGGRKDAAGKFNLTGGGLINATACYFAIVVLGLVIAALMGQNPGLEGAVIGIILNALPLFAIWLVIGGTVLMLRPQHGAMGLLVPATYAMALILIIRLPLELNFSGMFTNALLGALGFMLYRGARGVSQLGIGISLAFAVLCVVVLVLVALGLYMLATGGAGIG